ncbi:DUF2922 domain-containing protein [Bacillus solimangrovi]|uniref:DUF2922 domain-containing protein n=1 Tax=Bacillus solimangrovi TaxID=1305675 RepID=A0A1E5LEE0_9BACI|nr:DUF2922 domain-containing protein [Bacillus solimangrovi]OEH92434.1 hypothetical protein BFG57_15745 [Bacillus solimangrovi]
MKKLELKFTTLEGTTATVSVDAPVEPVDPAAVSATMDEILSQDVFITSKGPFVSKKEARLVDHTVTTIELP